jgi:hypothetical protein
MHIISLASDADFQNYRNDPRRTAQAALLEKSSAMLELLPISLNGPSLRRRNVRHSEGTDLRERGGLWFSTRGT